ncbi:ergothioneine biosynthesis glutamate--cysteine ligase EgtA [Actinospica durhamensis]|uniref:Glutamate--cysteine ligase EgtA n=1 Tax=Actinospica durhamensis TaxID=1508375 RepID=A0A941EPI2_9ACTN|nr:ergothioneine biosynthesis glutamate--cysteine ligase EgtA [Actinospica durhamensis]MBR7835006.1 ergothioneine biosynthesis glutamate--cysteine ligase EgtA [Actinospica durhamensis]
MERQLWTKVDERLSAEAATDYIRGVCFKTGPPGSTGVELEWLVLDRAQPHRLVSPERLDEALASLPAADGRLPSGTRLTREPGGQLELSTSPAPRLLACVTTAAEDLALVGRALRAQGLELSGYGLDPFRDPQRVLVQPRYAAMERYFDRIGPWGRMMMRATTAIQVNLDAGTEGGGLDGYRARWQLAHRLGPVLVAAFANSPLWHGKPTGWRSTRQAAWKNLDPGRTSPPQDLPAHADPRDAWAGFALDAGLLCLRRTPSGDWTAPPGLTLASWLDGGIAERPATLDDLDYHLTTLFPPVRPRGWLELRMIDAQPGDGWLVPTLLAAVLLDDPEAAWAAWCATEPLCTASSPFPPRAVWARAARLGMSVPELARAAMACFEAAIPALARAGVPAQLREQVAAFAARYPARGRCPADELLDHPAALLPVHPEGTY